MRRWVTVALRVRDIPVPFSRPGWLPPLLTNARSPRLSRGKPGRVVASQGIRLLNVPANASRGGRRACARQPPLHGLSRSSRKRSHSTSRRRSRRSMRPTPRPIRGTTKCSVLANRACVLLSGRSSISAFTSSTAASAVTDASGHKDVSTTMIYTHALNRPGLAVRSPLD